MSIDMPAEPSWYMALIQGSTAIPKSIAKLIDTIGEQTGMFLEPTHIRRKGKAEADVAIENVKAESEVAVIELKNKLTLQNIEERAHERVSRREAKRQENIERITAQASKEMPDAVSDTPVGEDWLTQFFGHCQDVSDEQMQSVWSRILAGEVAQPSTFSLQTLAIVKVMSKEDADLFTVFCSLLWQTSAGLTPIIEPPYSLGNIPGVNLRFSDYLQLESAGLIRVVSGAAGYSIPINQIEFDWSYFGRRHTIKLVSSDPSASFRPWNLDIGNVIPTIAGHELAGIAGSSPNEEYRSSVVRILRQQREWEIVDDRPGPDGDKPGI
jgi:hypothetical protein